MAKVGGCKREKKRKADRNKGEMIERLIALTLNFISQTLNNIAATPTTTALYKGEKETKKKKNCAKGLRFYPVLYSEFGGFNEQDCFQFVITDN